MVRLRRPGWYEKVKTDPSPIDDALLQLVRELAAKYQIQYWYIRITWGRIEYYNTAGWLISRPVDFSTEVATAPGLLSQAELILPEYLKGKLSLDEWKVLFSLHLVRFKAYNSGILSKLLGAIAIAPRSLFFLILIYIPAALAGGLSGPVIVLPSPVLLLIILWTRRSLRKSLKQREFELDRNVATQFGTGEVLQVLAKMQSLEPIVESDFPFLAYWTPSMNERIGELSNPRLVDQRGPFRVPKIGLRGRAIIVVVGFAIYWGSGLVAGNLYARGQTMIPCLDNTCAALVVVAAVGFWTAIIGGISIVVWMIRRFL